MKTAGWILYVVTIVAGISGAAGVMAKATTTQQKPAVAATPAPDLPAEQKLAIRLAVKSIEAAQQKAQVAELEYAAARRDLADLVKAADTKPGYSFDLATLTYVPKPVPKDPGTP